MNLEKKLGMLKLDPKTNKIYNAVDGVEVGYINKEGKPILKNPYLTKW